MARSSKNGTDGKPGTMDRATKFAGVAILDAQTHRHSAVPKELKWIKVSFTRCWQP